MEIKKSGKVEQKKEARKYEVLEKCGVLGTKEYKKQNINVKESLELRYMKWNDAEPKYDIRWWVTKEGEDSEGMTKGITLTGEQLEALKNILEG